jgi:uncharacterized protein (UPF0210 family)
LADEARAYRFRMLTLHAGNLKWWNNPGLVEEAAYNLLEAVDKASEEGHGRPDTIRLSLPPAPSLSTASELSDELGSIADNSDILVNVGYYPVNTNPDDLTNLVRLVVLEGLYISLLFTEKSWDAARAAAKVLHAIAEEDTDASTRVGVNALGEPVVTPFYPLSSTIPGETLVTSGLTYPSFLLRTYFERGLGGLEEAASRAGESALELARYVASQLGVGEAGVDLSVAPWMEDSSLALVEAVSGVRLPEPGIAMGIGAVNQAIRRAAKRIGSSVGFNEVQLPVGEDSKLKARVSEGETRARDLARLSGVCLAGLDMVAVPFDEKGIAGLILEVSSYSITKRSPLGVRLIALDGVEAGDKVSLKRFGEIPVIDL